MKGPQRHHDPVLNFMQDPAPPLVAQSSSLRQRGLPAFPKICLRIHHRRKFGMVWKRVAVTAVLSVMAVIASTESTQSQGINYCEKDR